MKEFVILLLLLEGYASYAQVKKDTVIANPTPVNVQPSENPIRKRIRLGGSTGFWISTRQVHVEVAPLLAYYFPKVLTVGTGYRYIYTHDILYGKDLRSIGPNIFARAQLTKRIYFWSEWEHLNTQYARSIGNNTPAAVEQEDVNSFFAGLGYIRTVGKRGRGGISFQLLYNVLYEREAHSPYYSPLIYRIGYFF
jgi:hypothetical protein